MHTYIYIYIERERYTHTYIYIYIYIYVYTCIYISLSIYIYIYIYTHTNIQRYITYYTGLGLGSSAGAARREGGPDSRRWRELLVLLRLVVVTIISTISIIRCEFS